jgi:hypothetical protein
MSEGSTSARNRRVAAAEHVRCRQFDEDLVMVDLNGGEYFALDSIAARMWELLVSGRTATQIAATLALEYAASEDDILGDCVKLADDLLERGLLVQLP